MNDDNPWTDDQGRIASLDEFTSSDEGADGIFDALDTDFFSDEEVSELTEAYDDQTQLDQMGVTPEQFATVAKSNTDTEIRDDPRMSDDLFDPVGIAVDTVNTFIDAARRNNGKNIETLVSAGIPREEAERLAARVEDPRDNMTQADFEEVVEVAVVRSQSNGRFVKQEPQETNTASHRSPSNGRYVGDEFTDPDIGRDTETGRFTDGRGDF